MKAKTFISYINPIGFYFFFKELKTHFGINFLLMLFSTYFGIKGICLALTEFIQVPYYLNAEVEGNIQQNMLAVSFIPWTCKGLIAIISDLFPFCGYNKRNYCILYVIVGSTSCLVLGFVQFDTIYKQPFIGAILFFFLFLETAAMDILLEGKYAEQVNLKPYTKGNIITFVIFSISAGQILPTLIIGSFSDKTKIRYLFFIFFPFFLQPLIFLLSNCLINDSVEPSQNNRFNFDKFWLHYKLIIFTFFQSLLSFIIIFFVFFDINIQIFYILTAATILCVISFFLIPSFVARFMLYSFLTYALYINLTSALEYYYLADTDCALDGPHFDFFIIKTYGNLCSIFASLIAICFFQISMTKLSFRSIFWTTTLFRIVCSFSDIILINRWNRLIKIPDLVFFLLGSSLIKGLATKLDTFPQVIMTAKICPKYIEATMFALLAGYTNFGHNTSNLSGVFLMKLFSIKTLPPCDFTNLSWLVFFGHCILPSINIFTALVLIPKYYLSDDFQKKVETKSHSSERILIKKSVLQN